MEATSKHVASQLHRATSQRCQERTARSQASCVARASASRGRGSTRRRIADKRGRGITRLGIPVKRGSTRRGASCKAAAARRDRLESRPAQAASPARLQPGSTEARASRARMSEGIVCTSSWSSKHGSRGIVASPQAAADCAIAHPAPGGTPSATTHPAELASRLRPWRRDGFRRRRADHDRATSSSTSFATSHPSHSRRKANKLGGAPVPRPREPEGVVLSHSSRKSLNDGGSMQSF